VAAVAGVDPLGEFQVSLGRKRREKIESLKDEADLSPPDVGPLGVRNIRDILAVNYDPARGRAKQTAEQVKQRRGIAAIEAGR